MALICRYTVSATYMTSTGTPTGPLPSGYSLIYLRIGLFRVSPLSLFKVLGMATSEPPNNSLGLDLDTQTPTEPEQSPKATELSSSVPASHSDTIVAESADTNADQQWKDGDAAEKKKPYVNPDRVKTGGSPRVSQR